jgi:hypothetical protein
MSLDFKELTEISKRLQRMRSVEIIRRYFVGEDQYQAMCDQLCNWVERDEIPVE